MEKKIIQIEYERFSGMEDLAAADRELCEAAIKAIDGSYSPYSRFKVGAAVRLSDGSIASGANQENAASPSGLCAERTAMFAAHASHPELSMKSIAIASFYKGALSDTVTAPCGACRQVMAEYQKLSGQDMSIILYSTGEILKFKKVDDLLPFIFNNLETV